MKAHLYEFRWTSPECFEFQASSQGRFGKKPCQVGQQLSLEVCSDVFCAGSLRDGIWQACPEKASGKRKCDICRAREGNFVYTAFDGFNRENVTPQDLEQIQDAHVVYLAFFAEDLIKIGVSKVSRSDLRQLEQGSHATLFIAETPDGITARQIETLLRKGGLPDKVKPSQKKDFLCPQMAPSAIEKQLTSLLEANRSSLEGAHEHLAKFLLPSPRFMTWEMYYHVESVGASPKHFHSVSLQEGESVSGTISAAKGSFLLIETPEEIVSIGTKDLLGRMIEFADRPAGLQVKSAVQKALF